MKPPAYIRKHPLHIEVAIDGRDQGLDATYLAMMIAGAHDAEVTLVTVVSEPPVPSAPGVDLADTRERAMAMLRELRDFMTPDARILVEVDQSVPAALESVATREHQDLLVIGSSRWAVRGRIRIGRRARQLLADAKLAVAVAPKGLCAGDLRRLESIGVGYDGGPEAREALRIAGSLARGAGAALRVRAVVDDRLPYVGWTPTSGPDLQEIYDGVIEPRLESLGADARRAASATRADVAVEVKPGVPSEELTALSAQVDLLAIGSPRREQALRMALGGTVDELMGNARCPVMVVPRGPRSEGPGFFTGPHPGAVIIRTA
jgi:nucleotide-binding universal stress UspA family protein